MKIKEVKRIRESIGASHVVLYAIIDGKQWVASHGEFECDAREAASAANRLKASLQWPEALCRDNPLERICQNCAFFQFYPARSYINGEPSNVGDCLVEPTRCTRGKSDRACRYFEPGR